MSFIIAYFLRRRYTAKDDFYLLKTAYYCACIAFTPILGIPLYRFICARFWGNPWARIYNTDGSYA